MAICRIGSKSISFTPPQRLDALLAAAGVDFPLPCGGHHTCGKCRIGAVGAMEPPSAEEAARLNGISGQRYACMAVATGDVTLTLPEKGRETICTETSVRVETLRPLGKTLGAAIDIGTTTLAAYLYRLSDGALLATAALANPQSAWGADVLSRMGRAMEGESAALAESIRGAIRALLDGLCREAGEKTADVDALVLTGNTAMLYLLTGRDPAPIARVPFEPDCRFGMEVDPASLGLPTGMTVHLSRIFSAYVGGDLTSAALAAGFFAHGQVTPGIELLADIGTNGEMILKAHGKLWGCSTAAGPAFEGAGIYQGMRARIGAVCRVDYDGAFHIATVGNAPAEGICGSGLLDCVAALRRAGIIDETGYLCEDGHDYEDCITETDDQTAFRLPGTEVCLTAKDVRSLQLAKAAICAGMLALCHAAGVAPDEVERVLLAGGFGSALRTDSAEAIGLIPPGFAGKAVSIGNAAGTGASMLLLDGSLRREAEQMAAGAEIVELSTDPVFMEEYVEQMEFPEI